MLRDRRAEMAEAAVTLPAVLLVALFMVNAAIAAYAANISAGAAAYGARTGAVARVAPERVAGGAAWGVLRSSGFQGDWTVDQFVENSPGGVSTVVVSWRVPSYLSGLCALFGAACPAEFAGDSVAIFKKEGW